MSFNPLSYLNKSTLERLIYVLIALSAAAFVALGVLYLVEPEEYDPFGDYPLQTVVGERGDDGIREVSLSDGGFVVEGVKCSTSHEPFRVAGSNSFNFVNEPGHIIPNTAGQGTRVPGCTYWIVDPEENCPPTAAVCYDAFVNEFQGQLLDAVLADHAAGIYPIVEFQGEETPVEGGVTQRWFTEAFRIVP